MYVPNSSSSSSSSSSRLSLAPGGSKDSGVAKKTNKEAELEDQLHMLQSQRMEDFKMFEQKLVEKQSAMTQLQIDLKSTLAKVCEVRFNKSLKYKPAKIAK